jgi:zinc D-Ala-D-Ala dipeptidase
MPGAFAARKRGWLVVLLVVAGCAARPPRDPRATRPPDLVELQTIDPTIRTDVRYATAANFVGRPVYPEARVFLQRPAAEALHRVQQRLAPLGYGLVVFDGYRPWSVTKLFWDVTPPAKRQFVADPSQGSRHNRGCAVDASLVELTTGREVEMPSGYDEMTEHAHVGYAGGSDAARAHREVLRAAMEAEGFAVYEPEWWHYDFTGWETYPVLDLSFREIVSGAFVARPGVAR